MKVYDCFPFFNELDILEMRLNILDPVVDKFVLVEATKTHQGGDKELIFEKNKSRFDKFKDKIIHIIIDDYPNLSETWVTESHQRNCIKRGLTDCEDDDIIIISDLDEIPRPEKITEYKCVPGIKAFDMNLFYYHLNQLRLDGWAKSKMLSYKDFNSLLDDYEEYSGCCPKENNQGTTPTKIRMYTGEQTVIKDGGWHFSWLGNKDKLIYKLQSYSHAEHNKKKYKKSVERKIKSGKSLFRPVDLIGYGKLIKIKITPDDYPDYIVDNQEKLKEYIADGAKYTISDAHKILARRKIVSWPIRFPLRCMYFAMRKLRIIR